MDRVQVARMQLEPYIFFYGRCEEALQFYKSAIGGDFEISRFEGSPMAEQVPQDFSNKVMHGTFKGPGFSFMASDGRPGKTIDPDEGNISLCLSTSDEAEGKRVFGALSAGGQVGMPLAQAFWGGTFGMLTDRFGIEWMVMIG
jgi:PhnB protein